MGNVQSLWIVSKVKDVLPRMIMKFKITTTLMQQNQKGIQPSLKQETEGFQRYVAKEKKKKIEIQNDPSDHIASSFQVPQESLGLH